MTALTKIQSVATPKFPALYRFIVDGPDRGTVYLVTDGVDFDGICVDPAQSPHARIGEHLRIGGQHDPKRWARLPSGSSVTITQD